LGRLRRDGRLQPGRWGWARARQLDDRGRSRSRRLGMDVARFGDWATLPYTNAKVRENYSRRFRIRVSQRRAPAARPLRTTPIYDRLIAENAGVRRILRSREPAWFAPKGQSRARKRRSVFERAPLCRCGMPRRARAGRHDRNRQLREIEVEGRARRNFSPCHGQSPTRVGRLALSPMLKRRRQIDRRLHDLPPRGGQVPLVCSYAAKSIISDGSKRHLPAAGSFAGPPRWTIPGSRSPGPGLATCCRADARGRIKRRLSVPVVPPDGRRHDPSAGRSRSFSGELGYEIWVRPEYQRALHTLLLTAANRGLSPSSEAARWRPCGWKRASARGRASTDRSTVRMRRARPVRRPTQERFRRALGGRSRKANWGQATPFNLAIEATDADAIGDEPIWRDGRVVGWVTSGGYGHSVGRSLAMGYIEKDHAEAEAGFRDRDHRRTPSRRPLFAPAHDPAGAAMRS